jgi:hypothetical protein
MVIGYGLDEREVGFRVPVWSNFSLLHIVQTGSGAHSASYPMGNGGSFPGVKWQGREADHSPPTSAEVKKIWTYIDRKTTRKITKTLVAIFTRFFLPNIRSEPVTCLSLVGA